MGINKRTHQKEKILPPYLVHSESGQLHNKYHGELNLN